MPKVRYTIAEVKRLAQSLLDYFDPPSTATEDEIKASKSRWFLLEWCIKEDVPMEEVLKMSKRSVLFALSYKKSKSICEMRLARLMIEEPKRCIPIIFAMKNKYEWRDDPLQGKGANSNKLTLNLTLPSKIPLSIPDKSNAVNALWSAVDRRRGVSIGQRKRRGTYRDPQLEEKSVKPDVVRGKGRPSKRSRNEAILVSDAVTTETPSAPNPSLEQMLASNDRVTHSRRRMQEQPTGEGGVSFVDTLAPLVKGTEAGAIESSTLAGFSLSQVLTESQDREDSSSRTLGEMAIE